MSDAIDRFNLAQEGLMLDESGEFIRYIDYEKLGRELNDVNRRFDIFKSNSDRLQDEAAQVRNRLDDVDEERYAIRARLSEARAEMNRQREINIEFNKTIMAKGLENDQLRAQLEQVTKERDEAREKLTDSEREVRYQACIVASQNELLVERAEFTESYVNAYNNLKANQAGIIKQRDSARAQRDRAMELLNLGIFPQGRLDALKKEIAKEGEGK